MQQAPYPTTFRLEATYHRTQFGKRNYWDTMFGLPPTKFLNKYGFTLSEGNKIGIIPCTDTLSRFNDYLRVPEHYQVLLDTCRELGYAFSIHPFYKTMCIGDVMCYLEYTPADPYSFTTTHRIAPAKQLNGLVDLGSISELDGDDLFKHFNGSKFAFLAVHDDNDYGGEPHPLLKPNPQFMAAFVRSYRKAGFSVPDSVLSEDIRDVLGRTNATSGSASVTGITTGGDRATASASEARTPSDSDTGTAGGSAQRAMGGSSSTEICETAHTALPTGMTSAGVATAHSTSSSSKDPIATVLQTTSTTKRKANSSSTGVAKKGKV